MANVRFEQLSTSIFEMLGVRLEPPTLDDDGVMAFHMDMDGVIVNVLHMPQRSAEHLAVQVIFGTLPPDVELEAWRALAEANYLMMGPAGQAFSRDPLSHDVVLQFTAPLDAVQPAGFVQALKELADLARAWRVNPLQADLGSANSLMSSQQMDRAWA